MKATILLSGGLDSMACTHYMLSRNFDVSGTFVDYGQPALELERKSATDVASILDVALRQIKMPFPSVSESGEIPGRNGFLIYSALMNLRPVEGLIVIGIHAETPYYDCSAEFLHGINKLISEETNGMVQIAAPLLEWNKAQVVKYILDNNLPAAITYSCERGESPPCGKCLSCKDRRLVNEIRSAHTTEKV